MARNKINFLSVLDLYENVKAPSGSFKASSSAPEDLFPVHSDGTHSKTRLGPMGRAIFRVSENKYYDVKHTAAVNFKVGSNLDFSGSSMWDIDGRTKAMPATVLLSNDSKNPVFSILKM